MLGWFSSSSRFSVSESHWPDYVNASLCFNTEAVVDGCCSADWHAPLDYFYASAVPWPHCFVPAALNLLGSKSLVPRKVQLMIGTWLQTNLGLNPDSVACQLCDLKVLSVSPWKQGIMQFSDKEMEGSGWHLVESRQVILGRTALVGPHPLPSTA